MKIVVCIKQVPDTVEVKIDPKTGTLIRDGVPSIINHDDKTGIEAALTLREQVGGTVTVVSMGPPQADVALREALAMGCDEAILVSAREFGGSDTYATSGIIAAALKQLDYDLIITGRQAIDGDTAQVGPQIAEKLHVPQVSYVEEIKEAARRANMDEFIMQLPKQYDTYVGEKGTRLSGGQKQRISIARVFLKNPPILILDEATSALDNESERYIQKSLEELAKNRTTITIAHRLSTIKRSDEIIVITEDGIAERGTHETLLAKNGIYARYYNL